MIYIILPDESSMRAFNKKARGFVKLIYLEKPQMVYCYDQDTYYKGCESEDGIRTARTNDSAY